MSNSLSKANTLNVAISAPLALSCIWIVMALLVNPVGNFPLNDDCVYGRTVHHLVTGGRLQFTWEYAVFIAQVLWGALFCLPFGFSFTALRVSTLCLGLLGILATYRVLVEAGVSQSVAFIGALLIAINPLYFVLSNTFMTDIPFFAFSMVSFIFFMRVIRFEKKRDIIIASLFACIATLIRQYGIVIPLSFGIAYFAGHGINRKTARAALFPAILVMSVFVAYYKWLQMTQGIPTSYSFVFNKLILVLREPVINLIYKMAYIGKTAFIYLGVFLFPLLLLYVASKWEKCPKGQRFWLTFVWSVISIVLMARLLFWNHKIMPLTKNIWYDFGLGPPLLRDEFVLQLPHLYRAPPILWLSITVVGVFGAAILLQNLCSIIGGLFRHTKVSKPAAEKRSDILVISEYSIYLTFLGLAFLSIKAFFDRYLIFLLPLSILIIRPIHLRVKHWLFFVVVVLCVIYTIFTVAATHDYLSWNRARWKALHYLTEESNISYKKIDGGYEFNNWYGYNIDTWHELSYMPGERKNSDNEYVVSFGPIIGYKEIRRYPYKRWLSFSGEGNIFILHRSFSSNDTLSSP